MAAKWIELVTGSFEDKKRYRRYKARSKKLPENYRDALAALERYLMYYGAVNRGDVLLEMLDDLCEFFEQGAADGTSIRGLVGEDPVEFAETFMQNYASGQWINKERTRLKAAIESAAGEGRKRS